MNIQKLLKAKKVIIGIMDEKISTKLGYKFLKFCKTIDTEEEFFNKQMMEIITKYCKKNEDGSYESAQNGGIAIQEDKIEECNKAVEELSTLDVEKPEFTFTIDELSELRLSVADLLCLEDFIVE